MKTRQHQKLLQELCQALTEGIHIVDADGLTIVYNEAMSTLEKIRPEEVLGKPFRKVFSNIPEGESTLWQALHRGTSVKNQPQTYLNKYNREISTINSTIPVRDYDGNIIAAIEISKDITHIKVLSNTILDLQSESQNSRVPVEAKIPRYQFGDIIGKSPNFLEVLHLAEQAAKSSVSVFISGETGTGKELFAQSIHFASDRKSHPFLAQNCAALPESLLEGILFGTEKGGFTGALDREGLFEQANGGTLLLDELSAMPYELQSKLLRVLQENYIRRVGGVHDIPIDVRIIATVNEDPEMLIRTGKLRKDLYYRLCIINLEIPPLRKREGDILFLAESFLNKYNTKFEKRIWMLSDDAKNKLLAYDYPGNTRELENIIMSAIALAGTEHVLTAASLNLPNRDRKDPFDLHSGEVLPASGGFSLDEYLTAVERDILHRALAESNGNISQAAARLGIQRQTLQYKIKKYQGNQGDGSFGPK